MSERFQSVFYGLKQFSGLTISYQKGNSAERAMLFLTERKLWIKQRIQTLLSFKCLIQHVFSKQFHLWQNFSEQTPNIGQKIITNPTFALLLFPFRFQEQQIPSTSLSPPNTNYVTTTACLLIFQK